MPPRGSRPNGSASSGAADPSTARAPGRRPNAAVERNEVLKKELEKSQDKVRGLGVELQRSWELCGSKEQEIVDLKKRNMDLEVELSTVSIRYALS